MNIKRFVILSTLLCMLVSSTVLADQKYTAYQIKNSGHSFQKVSNSCNYKETNWNSWYVVAKMLHYYPNNSKKGWGVCYTALHENGEYAGTSSVWILNESDSWYIGSWNGNNYTGNYYLGVRSDSIFNGSYIFAQGKWNADYR